ncbi:MAG: bifunctional diguanylate cyclase/phosphodiesterase [Saccharofermentans sp.]|nr:bifunctional diguanylate cyclase/phosphodiesterase [Saccharofermentans sp.]
MVSRESREDTIIFKSGKGFYFGLIMSFVCFIALLAVCCVSVDDTTRFTLCLVLVLLSFVINVGFGKYGFYVSFVLSFMQLLIHSYEFLVLGKEGSVYLAIITLLVIIINVVHKIYLNGVLKKIYSRRKIESAERARAINKQLEDDIFARTKLISSHETEKKSSHPTLMIDPAIDTLTTLPGRAMITDRLNRLIEEDLARMQRSAVPDSACNGMTIIYFSLDEISLAKFNIGHKSMDLFIQNMAHRIREAADPADMVARIYGTEFVVLAKRLMTAEEITEYKHKLTEAMKGAFTADNEFIDIRFDFGIAVYPEDGTSAEELITKAEEAMTGKINYGGVATHKSAFTGMASSEIITMFEDAIRTGDLTMMYQPCYRADGRLTGFEAFMRWRTETHEIYPNDFIRAAVKSGYMRRIGNFSLETALDALASINKINSLLTMNINISNDQLRDPGFITEFSNALSNSGAELGNVILDISEESLFTELPEIKSTIEKLSSMGANMALDNFGRGYSSFNAIPLLPISTLKLDGNFTRDLLSDINVRVLSSAAISLMHDIDITVCATGVGDAKQLELLKQYGCDYFQGNVLGAPVNEFELEILVRK